MDFLDKIGDALISATKEVSGRAKDVSDSTKLSYDVRKKKQDVDEAYIALGKKYYEEHKDSSDEDIKNLSALLDEVTEMEVQIAGLRGGRRCTECGAIVPMDSGYCNKCGAKIDDSIFEDEDDISDAEGAEE